MLDRCSDATLAALLVALSLPLLAWYLILAGFDSLRSAAARRQFSRGYKTLGHPSLLKPQFVGEFAFERAIEAYEHLIDSTYAEGRR